MVTGSCWRTIIECAESGVFDKNSLCTLDSSCELNVCGTFPRSIGIINRNEFKLIYFVSFKTVNYDFLLIRICGKMKTEYQCFLTYNLRWAFNAMEM